MSVLTLITLLCLCGQSKVEGSVGIFEMNACDMDIILFIHHIDGNKAVCVCSHCLEQDKVDTSAGS